MNLLRHARAERHYSSQVFERRDAILEQGYYDHVLGALAGVLDALLSHGAVLDVGCGSGFYARRLSGALDRPFAAIDIVKECIRLGARLDRASSVMWSVGDSARLPVHDGCAGAILDVFAPASYREFNRVLADDGCVVKAIPGPRHVVELRCVAGSLLRVARFDEERVERHFERFYDIIDVRDCTATLPVDDEARAAFIEMTPLLFNVDMSQIDISRIKSITVDARIVVGWPRKGGQLQ